MEETINALRAIACSSLGAWKFRQGDFGGPERPDYDDRDWQVVGTDYRWLPPDSKAWYRTWIDMPPNIGGLAVAGATVWLYLRVDDDGIVYVNGKETHRFHSTSPRIVLTQSAQAGERFFVAVQVINYAATGQLVAAELRSDRSEALLEAARTYLADVEVIQGLTLAGQERIRRDSAVQESLLLVDLAALERRDGAALLSSVAGAHERLVGILDGTRSKACGQLEDARHLLRELDDLLGLARNRGIDASYPTVSRTVVEQFLTFAEADLGSERPQVIVRGAGVADYLVGSCHRAIRETRTYLNDEDERRSVPRYRTGALSIERGAFMQDGRPRFFVGFGHFDQVRNDVPIFNDYGFTIIQVVITANRVLPTPESVDTTEVDALVAVLDRAAKHHVAVNVLLGPNMPTWAFDRHPDLKNDHLRFFRFNVDHAVAREVYGKYLRVVIPRIARHPALFSIDLMNEPTYEDFSPRSLENFRAWLKGKHGSIERFNERCATGFRNFDEITVTNSLPYQEVSRQSRALWYEWCLFTQDRFAAFHEWMRDVIHDMDPATPIHVKVMAEAFTGQRWFQWGLDFERFTRIDRISGNDCYSYERRDPDEEYAQIWLRQAMYYDFQRSVAPNNPIFNSENHPIEDGKPSWVSGDHLATMLWQGAIHGQGATTTWVWERHQRGELSNNILTRPNCVEASGRTALDLARLGEEIVALQRMPGEVALLFSPSSIPLNEPYLDEMKCVYEGLYFLDAPVRFVSERMIEESGDGALARYRLLVAPRAGYVREETVSAVERYVRSGGALVMVGDAFRRDEYGAERARLSLVADGSSSASGAWDLGRGRVLYCADGSEPKAYARLFDELLDDLGVERRVRVVDDYHGRTWGVVCRAVEREGAYLVYLVNLLNRQQTVKLIAHEPLGEAIDLISGARGGPLFELEPLRPMLLRVKRR